jgi:hypothetical protein
MIRFSSLFANISSRTRTMCVFAFEYPRTPAFAAYLQSKSDAALAQPLLDLAISAAEALMQGGMSSAELPALPEAAKAAVAASSAAAAQKPLPAGPRELLAALLCRRGRNYFLLVRCKKTMM